MKINYLLIALAFCAMQVQAQQCPTVLQCPVDTTILCYTNSNTAGLWQNMQFYDALRESDDLTEAAVAVNLRLLDTCAAFVLPACHLFFDLNGDGLVESYFYSDSVQAPGTLRSTVGGSEQDLSFDQRVLPDSMKYRLVVDTLRLGDTLEARLLFVNALGSTPAILPDAGVFDLIWLLDGDTLCRRHYRLRDCQPPVVTCLPVAPIVISGFPNIGTATFWPTEAMLSLTDNATAAEKIKFGIIRASESTGMFPEPVPPLPFSVITVNCSDELFSPFQAELWVCDLAGNTSFCSLAIEVLDPGGICGEEPPTLDICIKTTSDISFAGARVNFDYITTVMPFNTFDFTESSGCVRETIGHIPGLQYVNVRPVHRHNYVNGVSSYDLLLISKHILGIEVLNSPYKMIAADANRSGTITTLDITELRKIVLGVDTVLANNDSWRFIPKMYSFPNPSNPFVQVVPDSIRMNWPLPNYWSSNGDFIAVKIGDINLNALPFTDNIPQDRNLNDSLSLILPHAQNGELVPIYFEKARLEGFQWSLQNVEPELLVPGPGLAEENFAWSAEHRTLRCSWISPDGAAQDFDASRPICWLKLKAAPEGLESGFVSEAYEAGAVRRSIRVEKAEPLSLAPAQVVVAPNPTSGSAWVQGHLEQAGAWSFQVMDAQGRLLWERDGNTSDNALYLKIPATAIEPAGLYFWVFSAGKTVQTGQLIKN